MQSFDAKPISPFPSGSGKPQKTGGGDGVGGSAEEIVTLSHSLHRPPRATRTPDRLERSLGGGGQREAKPGRPRPFRELPRIKEARRHTFGFPLSGSGCPALPHPAFENPGASGSLPHSPSSNAGERRRGKGAGASSAPSAVPGAPKPGQAPLGARGRESAPSPAPALPVPRPFPFLWVPVKPSSPETSAEHHGICADASR